MSSGLSWDGFILPQNKKWGEGAFISKTCFKLTYADLAEKAMAPHSSTLAWKIPWMEEPGGLQSTEFAKSRTRLSDFTFTFHFHALEKETATHSSVLAWRIPGTEEPGRLPSMVSHRIGHDWSDLAAAAACRFGLIMVSLTHIWLLNLLNN